MRGRALMERMMGPSSSSVAVRGWARPFPVLDSEAAAPFFSLRPIAFAVYRGLFLDRLRQALRSRGPGLAVLAF